MWICYSSTFNYLYIIILLLVFSGLWLSFNENLDLVTWNLGLYVEIYRSIKSNRHTVSRMAVVRPDPVTS